MPPPPVLAAIGVPALQKVRMAEGGLGVGCAGVGEGV